MPRIPRFLRLPRSASKVRSDVDDELRFDLEMRALDLERQGLSAGAAQERAAAEFGDLEFTRRYCEEIDMQIEAGARHSNFFEELRSDLVIALRGMRRTPAFAAVVLLTLAVGIGANTAVYSVVRRVLVTPLPFRAPNELYRLYTTPAATDGDDDKLSAVELNELATRSRSVAGVTMFGNYAGALYSDDNMVDAWQTVSVAPNFFDVLGIRPVLGRSFAANDFVQGAPSVVVISYGTWQRVFGGDSRVVGRLAQLSGKGSTVIGVLPEHFVGPTFTADVLRPLNVAGVMNSPQSARSRAWRSVVRLRTGISPERFRSELAVLRPGIQASYPEIRNAGVFLPRPLHEAIVGTAGPVLRVVMSAALVVLLAACINIAGLFLSRAAAQRRELGVRSALGAVRARLVRQVMAEALLYGAAGGALGVLLAFALKAALLHVAGSMLPQLGEVRIDAGALVFAFAASLASGVAFGVMPALVATRVDLRDALGDGGSRSVSRGSGTSRASRLLVTAQVAFAVVLVVGASLLVRTFQTLVNADLGFETSRHQATFYLSPGARYPDHATEREFIESFIKRVHALPGVTAAGYTVTGPWNGAWRSIRFRVDGRPVDSNQPPPAVVLATGSSEFLAAAGIPVRMGRGFNAGDRLGAPPVVVISESMAHRYWPGSSPIGARLRMSLDGIEPRDSTAVREVVGVVADVRPDAMAEASPTLYVSAEQTQLYGSVFVVRTRGDAADLLPLIKDVVHTLDPRVPMLSPRTLRDVLSAIVKRQNVAMTLIAAFALLALLLSGLGVYGVTAYGVAARTREFGIRSALGASHASIVGLVLRDAASTTLLGLAAGLLVAAAAWRLAASLLVGVTPRDPWSFAAALVVLGLVAIAACVGPARAALRIQATEALRLE